MTKLHLYRMDMKYVRDLAKVFDPKGRLIAVLNFNNMVPVDQSVAHKVDLRVSPMDDSPTRAFKLLMGNQIDWCNAHRSEIIRKANRLYDIVTTHPEKCRGLTKRCCDFKRLERVLDSRLQN